MTRKPKRSESEVLGQEVERQVQRLNQAERDRPTLLGQTVYVGVLGLLFVLPVIGGAYLGRWLDGLARGYSIRWTMSLIFLGIMVGAINVYFFVRE